MEGGRRPTSTVDEGVGWKGGRVEGCLNRSSYVHAREVLLGAGFLHTWARGRLRKTLPPFHLFFFLQSGGGYGGVCRKKFPLFCTLKGSKL
jgi:hypothetical protein